MNVFDAFPNSRTDYTFYIMKRGTVTGNMVVSSYPSAGIFKRRSRMATQDIAEEKTSNPRLHIKSTEDFIAEVNGDFTGHCVLCEGVKYEVIGSSGGDDYDNNIREHYTLILQESNFDLPV